MWKKKAFVHTVYTCIHCLVVKIAGLDAKAWRIIRWNFLRQTRQTCEIWFAKSFYFSSLEHYLFSRIVRPAQLADPKTCSCSHPTRGTCPSLFISQKYISCIVKLFYMSSFHMTTVDFRANMLVKDSCKSLLFIISIHTPNEFSFYR